MIKTLKKVLKDFIKNNGKKYFFTIVFGFFIMSILDILTPFFYKEIITIIENFVKTQNLQTELLIKIFIIWFVFIIFSNLYKAGIEYILAKANLKNYKQNHLKYSEKILFMNYGEYLNQKSGTIFKRYDRGQEDTLELIYTFFGEIFVAVSSIIIITIILFIINFKMAIATLIMVPLMIMLGYYFNVKTRLIQDKINKLRDKAFGIIGDSLNNLGLTKTLVLEKIFKKKFKKEILEADTKQQTVMYRWILADVYANILINLSRFLVLGTGIFLIYKKEIDFATLFLFFTYVGHIYFPLAGIFRRLKMLQRKLKGIQNFYELFDNLTQDKFEKNKLTLKNPKGEIKYKNVGFSYNSEKQILKNINLTIKPGEKIALVGNTGAGKSTLVNLLFRFWNINSGEIFIDSKNIQDYNKESLRKNIGFVMQDNSLFNTTIEENLLFANPKATQNDIEKALKNAEAHFVFKLKDGLNTIIGERGLKLSGGEKQRIAIARLFLKNPKILILDEATSALDNKTEKMIQKALDKLMKGRTSIIIAHRLSTIENADKIYMLENGEIIEAGTYKELIKKKAKFYNLANPEHLILN